MRKGRIAVRIGLTAACLIALAACSRGGGEEGQNLGAATGNTLTPAEIDAALGPANQAEPLPNSVSAMPANATAPDARRHATRSPSKTR